MNTYTLVSVLFPLCMCHSAVSQQKFNPFLDAWRLRKPSYRVNLAQSNGRLCPVIPDPEIGDIASRKPSFQLEVRLYGLKAAAWLQVAADGTVNGTLDTTSEFGKLQLLSMGSEVIRVKGVATGRYIAMNINGSLYSTAASSVETIFKHTSHSSYLSFASAKFCRNVPFDMFLALGGNGKTRNGKTTKVGQKTVKFFCFLSQESNRSPDTKFVSC